MLVGDAVRDRPAQVGEQRAREAQLDAVQPAEDVDRDVLDDVVGVGQPVRLAGQAHPGEPLQRALVAGHEHLPGRLIALAGALDQVERRAEVDGHPGSGRTRERGGRGWKPALDHLRTGGS